MRQHINLYQVKKQKITLQFTFRHAVFLFGVFFAVISAVTLYDLVQHLKIKKELNVLGKEQIQKAQKLEAIKGETLPERSRTEIQTELTKAQEERRSKQEILAAIAMVETKEVKGYSEYFESLAKSAITGIWLTSFSLKDVGQTLVMQGKALTADYVPKLILGLSAEPVFSGKTFELFRVVLDDKTQQVDFTLQTKSYQQP